jgi:hypothetical protein
VSVDESPKFREILGRHGSEEQKRHLSHGGGKVRGQNLETGGRRVELDCKCGAVLSVLTPAISPD